MKRRILIALSVLVVVFGVISVSTLKLSNGSQDAPAYKVNKNGQTYGTADFLAEADKGSYPELLAATGVDGTEGYIYAVDLETCIVKSTAPPEVGEDGEPAPKPIHQTIPLYESDGETIIGKFSMSKSD